MHTSTPTAPFFLMFDKRLKSFILSRVRDKDTADDILQDVYVKVHSHIETLSDSTKLEPWIYQITRNAIVDYYRNRKEFIALPENIEEEPAQMTPGQRLSESLHDFINRLPPSYRAAIELSELQGKSQKEVAEHLGISYSGAKSRIQRGRKLLKEMLLQCCHFEFDRSGAITDYYPHSTSSCPVCTGECSETSNK